MNENAIAIINALNTSWFPTAFVGGCVRDKLMGKTPHDFDIVTEARPEQVKEVLARIGAHFTEVGESFGIVVAVLDGETFEIASTREDIHSEASDGRHPDSVKLGVEIETDLARRDFTMNAMAFDPDTDMILDPFGGESDVKNGVIRFVGNPAERIAEDNLRIMRAFRFASTLGFKIDREGKSAISDFFNNGGSFDKISQERITSEFTKLIVGKDAFSVLIDMIQFGILFKIIPEMEGLMEPHNNHWHQEEVAPFGMAIMSHVLKVVKAGSEMIFNQNGVGHPHLPFMLACLFHDIGKPACRERKQNGEDRFLHHDQKGAEITEALMTRMKFPKVIIEDTVELVLKHMNVHDLPKMKKPHAIRKLMGGENFKALFHLGIADTIATEHVKGVINLADCIREIDNVVEQSARFPVMLPAPLITGQSLIDAKIKPGPSFKSALEVAFNMQLDGIDNPLKLLNQAISHIKTVEK